jgi:hypothetical protein
LAGIRPPSPFRLARARLILLALGALAFPAPTRQAELPEDVLLLNRIKAKMEQNLSRIPNYTCLETMVRGQHASNRLVIAAPGKSVPFRTRDIVRFEVAEVGGVELFARPGEHNFEKRDLRELASTGLIGDGIFSGFAHDVFRSAANKFVDEVIDGRKLLRYDFRIPLFMSGYRVGTDAARALVGYHGSFWADPETSDAVRMDVIADDIPPETGLAEMVNRVDFARVHIGGSDALLPQSAEMTARVLEGSENRNRISFTHCREYGVQSVISYEDLSDPAGGTSRGRSFIDLPSGLLLTLKLDTPVDASAAHIGDVLSATVDVDARYKGTLYVPKDAVITGRLRRLELHKEGWPYVLVGLEFIEIEFESKQSRFFADLEKIILPPGAEGPKRVQARDLPGVGMVTARGNNLRLPAGTRMIWKTISYEQAAEVGK